MTLFEVRWLAGCGLLLGVGAGLVWAGGIIARALDDAHDWEEEEHMTPASYWHWEWLIGR